MSFGWILFGWILILLVAWIILCCLNAKDMCEYCGCDLSEGTPHMCQGKLNAINRIKRRK